MSQIDNISDIDFFVAEQIKQYNKIPDDDPERFVQAAPPQPEPEKTSTTSNIFKKAALTALTIGATAIAGNAVRKQFFSPSNLNMGRVGRERVITETDFDNTDLLGRPLDRPPTMRPMPQTQTDDWNLYNSYDRQLKEIEATLPSKRITGLNF